jgi:predicted CXXCH cytochrome family protein
MKRLLVAVAVLATATAARAGRGGSVVGSKHDLSITGPGPIRAMGETNVCLPCHVPHSGMSNRPELRAPHIPYESTTMAARPGAPTGATRVCLSCHDGTIAVGETAKGKRIPMTVGTIPADRPSNLGTDLRKTHPVSFVPLHAGRTHPPVAGDAVKLDRTGQVQCTSCHDPHVERGDPVVGKFLVKPSGRSALCLTCHDSVAVQAPGSSHSLAAASFGPAQGNDAGFPSVADAGCLACHATHGGDGGGRLLDRPLLDDDALCLRCHGSAVTRRDIGREVSKPYAHATRERGVHDAAEGRPGASARLPEASPGAPRHVACVDCHDPHAASDRPSLPPGVGGALAGVWGIDENGQRVEQVRFEYEVCFKCHGDSANKPHSPGSAGGPASTRREQVDLNLRRVFAASAASYHPVVAPGRNPFVPSLKPPYTAATLVTCGDCHASETGPGAGGGGPRGPHGSVHPYLLERSYATADHTAESPAVYALCYKCHDREVLLSDPGNPPPDPARASSFPEHRRHVGPTVNAPCSACHAVHGVSALAGTPDANAHLIDFDVSIVKPLGGVRRYQSGGPARGSCTLTCHGRDHAAAAYPPAWTLGSR